MLSVESRRLAPLLAGLALAFGASRAWAGGLWVYETAVPDVGTASAGRAALANDAATTFGNPAGMTRLPSQLLFGLQPLVVTAEFDRGAGTTISGTNGGNAGGLIPAGGIYGVYSLRDDLKLGIAFNSYVGGAVNYESNWAGRYITTEAELLTFNLNPVIAYRVLPWLSLGVGFSAQWAKLKDELAINNVAESLPDGFMKYQDTNFGFGGNVGALFEIDDRTRLGITYRSQVDQRFSDVPSFGQLGPVLEAALRRAGVLDSSLDLGVSIPQEVMVSVYRDVTDDLALMANFNWQDWSQFGEVNVALSTTPPRAKAVNTNYDGSFQGAIGAHYRLGEPTMLLLGFAYDSSPATEHNRSPALPVDQQLRFAAGIQYDVNADYTIGAAYEYADLGKANINVARPSGTLQGDYQAYSLNVFNFTVIRRF
ncbi:outer membrane protein transport protein [bacterium]|nr:outer membrane protein transport protein [bacterium]